MNVSLPINSNYFYTCQHGLSQGYCAICNPTGVYTNVYANVPIPPAPAQKTNLGWECPRCANIWSPEIHLCLFCSASNQKEKASDVKVTTDAANS